MIIKELQDLELLTSYKEMSSLNIIINPKAFILCCAAIIFECYKIEGFTINIYPPQEREDKEYPGLDPGAFYFVILQNNKIIYSFDISNKSICIIFAAIEEAVKEVLLSLIEITPLMMGAQDRTMESNK